MKLREKRNFNFNYTLLKILNMKKQNVQININYLEKYFQINRKSLLEIMENE